VALGWMIREPYKIKEFISRISQDENQSLEELKGSSRRKAVSRFMLGMPWHLYSLMGLL